MSLDKIGYCNTWLFNICMYFDNNYKYYIFLIIILLPCSIRKLKYGDGKKNRVRYYCRFWLYYTQNMKKVVFWKVSVCLSVCRCFSMANDNSRKFKQNQIIFCIQPWFVEDSRPIVFGEDRLRERGSLPATFYVSTTCLLYTSRCV